MADLGLFLGNKQT